MDIKVKGGQVLSGEITPSGSKNSAVHLIPTTLLVDGITVLKNLPEITDVTRLFTVLKKLGSKIEWDTKKCVAKIDNSSISPSRLTAEDLGSMKGMATLWGALLARFGRVDFSSLPGGCTLGIRPFEPHFRVFRDLGATIKELEKGGSVAIKSTGGREIWLSEMSPTATTNAILVATSLIGKTKIVGAASEPQVQDVCNFLIRAGAKIRGVGSSVLEIEGRNKLEGISYELLSDHYEIATFLALVACTGGEIKVYKAIPEYFRNINNEFKKFNVEIEYEGDMAVVRKNQKIRILGKFEKQTNVVRAQPWPALPVDLLPIFVPLALAAPSKYILFHNWMYESGLFWTSELTKLGAEIVMCDPHRAMVFGGRKLRGAELEAPYIIRATVAMVMSAMIAEGESMILDADALYRGHPHFAENLKKLGAKIEVLDESH